MADIHFVWVFHMLSSKCISNEDICQQNIYLGCFNLSSTNSVQLSQFWISKKTLQGWDGLEKTPHDQTLKWEMRSFLQSYLVDDRPGMLLRYRSGEGAEQGGEADHPTILIIRFKTIIGKNDFVHCWKSKDHTHPISLHHRKNSFPLTLSPFPPPQGSLLLPSLFTCLHPPSPGMLCSYRRISSHTSNCQTTRTQIKFHTGVCGGIHSINPLKICSKEIVQRNI